MPDEIRVSSREVTRRQRKLPLFPPGMKNKERGAIKIEARDADEAKVVAKNAISSRLRTIFEYRNVTCTVILNYYMLLYLRYHATHVSVSKRVDILKHLS